METMRPYLRVSHKVGESKSTGDQLTDLTRDAGDQGWTLGPAYTDDGISASKFRAGRARDDFARLLADLAADEFDAQIIGLWEGSRGSRDVGEWVELLGTLERKRVKVWVSIRERLYRPWIAGDRKDLLTEAVDAEYEAAKISGRTRRGVAEQAARGMPYSQAPFGYARLYRGDTSKRVLVRQFEVPEEADLVRELFSRLAAGHTLRGIRLDWETRGVRSRAGRVFSEVVLRGMALNPSYCGRRLHRGKVYESDPKIWERIVTAEQFDTVAAILTNPDRKSKRDGQGRHLLSMIAVCDPCDAPLTSSTRGGEPPHLRCRANCGIQANEAILDRIAEAAIIGYLSRPDVYAELTKDRGDDPEVERVEAELAAYRVRRVELQNALADPNVPYADTSTALTRVRAEIERLERRKRELLTPPALAAFLGDDGDVAARWEAAPLSARRAVARLVLSPELFGQMRLGKSTTNRWCAECRKPTCVHRVAARIRWRRGQHNL